jgi:hypothetical protein
MVPASTWLGDSDALPARGGYEGPNWHRHIPALRKEGPIPFIFWVCRPVDPLTWLAELIALSGDIESNPGPTLTWTCDICKDYITRHQTSIRCNHTNDHWLHLRCTDTRLRDYTDTWKCSGHRQIDPQPTSPVPTPNHQTTPDPHLQPPVLTPKPIKNLHILQININGISNKIDELRALINLEKIDIVTVQETKLRPKTKTPTVNNFTAIRTDRAHKDGGGLLTYVKNDITFTDIKIPQTINVQTTEIQDVRIHLSNNKTLDIINLYIPPRDTRDPNHANSDNDITTCMTYILNRDRTILTGDINAHHPLWYSPMTDHRGTLIADLINNSTQLTLNTNTPTRIPTAQNQRPTSPDITTVTDSIYRHAHWTTLDALNSDHKPILTRLNTKTNFRLTQNRTSYTNYHKADWTKFTEHIEDALTGSTDPDDIHTGNRILTRLIIDADKYYIPKGKIRDKCKLLPQPIRLQIDRRNDIKAQDPLDNRLQQINWDINKAIGDHKTRLWKKHLDGQWDHRQNTHLLWKTINGLSNKKPPPITNNTIQFLNHTAITHKQKADQFTKQFTNTVKHATRQTYRRLIRKINQIETTPMTITIDQTIAAIKATKNNNSTGPDDVSIRHLKHLGPTALKYMTRLFNMTLNSNIIPQIWKLAKIIPIPKPNKDASLGTSYRPISLLSPIAKLIEKILHPYLTDNIQPTEHQHGFKTGHSTVTALHQITNHITTGFNQKRPPKRTITIALDMSKAFDTVNLHTLIDKITTTTIPNTIVKFISNYIRGRKAFTQYNSSSSFQKQFKSGVPQGGVLSPTLFNIYTSDLPPTPPDVTVTTYADDITIYSSDSNYLTAQQRLQPYLEDVYQWTKDNDLQLNATKTMTTLFTPDPAENSKTLTLQLDGDVLPTVKNPKILGLTFDPKMTFTTHVTNATAKATKTIKILKALTATKWGKQKETLTNTFKTVTRPVLEYASSVWSPMTAPTTTKKLQTVQNAALRVATGCTTDTNINHLHDETNVLPIDKHMQLHSSQLRQKAQHPDHTLHRLTTLPTNARHMKQTTFSNDNNYTTNIDTDPELTDDATIKLNMKTIHTTIVQEFLSNRPHNKLLNRQAPDIDKTEETLPRMTRRRLAQLRTDKSPLLMTYLHKIDPDNHPSDTCPLCNRHPHDTKHLFDCDELPTRLSVQDLWVDPVGVSALLFAWGEKLGWPQEGV